MSEMEEGRDQVGLCELTPDEIAAVSGGNPFMVALTVYAVADIAYDAYKGFRDGFSDRAN
ncbi:MAG TPA: hypothetical protein VM687_01620 [Stenotrophomonas sp.]|nr:hypothetical protein [Stenotrophomonas sp.]